MMEWKGKDWDVTVLVRGSDRPQHWVFFFLPTWPPKLSSDHLAPAWWNSHLYHQNRAQRRFSNLLHQAPNS